MTHSEAIAPEDSVDLAIGAALRASVGAGFVYPICGDMRTMPGLGRTPAAKGIDLVFDDGDPEGRIIGLS